jgi:nucleoid DNA-binding protein
MRGGVETKVCLSYADVMPLVLQNLVRSVAKASRLRKHEARVVVDRLIREVVEALRRGEKVEIRGLGTFESSWVKGRQGRDWKTGQAVALPPWRHVVFRPGRLLKPRKFPEKVYDRQGQVLLFGVGNEQNSLGKAPRKKVAVSNRVGKKT